MRRIAKLNIAKLTEKEMHWSFYNRVWSSYSMQKIPLTERHLSAISPPFAAVTTMPRRPFKLKIHKHDRVGISGCFKTKDIAILIKHLSV